MPVYPPSIVDASGNLKATSGLVAGGDTNLTRDAAGLWLSDPQVRQLSSTFRLYRDVSYFELHSGTVNGTLKITMPRGWSSTLQRIVIRGMHGSPNYSSWELVIGGYNFSGTGAWLGASAILHGNAPFSTVRLGYDSAANGGAGGCCILLGVTSPTPTAWVAAAQVAVTEVLASYAGVTAWGTGWSTAIIDATAEAALTGIVTPTLTQIGSALSVASAHVTGGDPASSDPTALATVGYVATAVAASGGTPYLPLGVFPVSQKWTILPTAGATPASSAFTAGATYWIPLPVNKGFQIDKFALNVIGSGGSGNWLAGVYPADSSMQPTVTPNAAGFAPVQLGAVDASLTGVQSPATMTNTPNLIVGTMYWLAVAAPTGVVTNLSGSTASSSPYLVDPTTAGPTTLASNFASYRQTGANGLPGITAGSPATPTGLVAFTVAPRVALLAH